MAFHIERKFRVGIDLGPANMMLRAPGTARHVRDQARKLFALDVPWDWVPLVDAETNPMMEELNRRGLKAVVVPGTKVAARATFSVGKAWKEQGCDLGFATAYFAPLSGCPVVANFFDSNAYEFGWTWVKSGQRMNYYINRSLSTYSAMRARRLFVNSNYCAQILKGKFPRQASKFFVTYPGASEQLDSALEKGPACLDGLSRPYCLFVGIFSENKNQRRLIQAWAKWQATDPDAPALILVGNSNGDYVRGQILPERERAPRRDEIILTGYLTDEEVAWCYRHASFYIQPSFAEGFGLPVIEAMTYDLPIAISNSSSLPEIGGDAALYFDPANVDSILEAARKLWGDVETRERLRDAGRGRRWQFTWARNAELVAGHIEAVLGEL